MAEVSESAASLTATTNGVSEDSSSSSSSSSSSASSSPTLDDDPHDMGGPSPKKPRLDPSLASDSRMEDHECTAAALSPGPGGRSPPRSPPREEGEEAASPQSAHEEGSAVPEACEARPSSEEGSERSPPRQAEDAALAGEAEEVGSSNHIKIDFDLTTTTTTTTSLGSQYQKKPQSNGGSPDSAQDCALGGEYDVAAAVQVPRA